MRLAVAGLWMVLGAAGCWGANDAGSDAAAAPEITARAALHGAMIVSLGSTTPQADIYYTIDGSVPTEKSQRYEAPFLVSSRMTVKAMTVVKGQRGGAISARTFAVKVAPGALVWSDEFERKPGGDGRPDATVWTYDTGNGGFGNHELETYCAWGGNDAPCEAADPSAYIGADGYLHIKAAKRAAGAFTSARLKTQGLFSFQYGRFEVRARVPEAQGFWPAAWLLGNNIATVDWPASGEQDVLERVNAAKSPDWNEGSVHGIGFTGDTGLGKIFNFPAGQTAAEWHTYGMIWKPGSVAYYVDDAAHPYVTYEKDSIKPFKDAVWPFDAGQSNFILLNLAVGGDWPKSPDASTPFPAEMLVDYVRIYKSKY